MTDRYGRRETNRGQDYRESDFHVSSEVEIRFLTRHAAARKLNRHAPQAAERVHESTAQDANSATSIHLPGLRLDRAMKAER
jgi:hypothetical protein